MGYIHAIQTPDLETYLIEPLLFTTANGTSNELIATINNFTLITGAYVNIKVGVVGTNATLNVNNTGAKDIYYNNAQIVAGMLTENNIYTFIYTGTYWEVIGDITNNTYTLTEVWCNTTASIAAKVSSNASYYYIDTNPNLKHYFELTLRYANTAVSALTLNINSQGAKPIYINGLPSSSTNYTLPRGKYLVYYDGTNYHFRTDGKLPGDIAGDAATVNGLTVQTAVPTNAKFTDTWQPLSISQNGYVSEAPNDTTKFLRGDASWAALPSATSSVPGITTVGASGGAAAYSHGVHVTSSTVKEALGTNATHNDQYLRKDGTWQTVQGGVSSVAELTGDITATALINELGLSKALRFVGKTTSTMSENFTGVPAGIANYTTPALGDVVLDKDNNNEYVCIAINNNTYTWESLGDTSSWALDNHVHGNISNIGTKISTYDGSNDAATTTDHLFLREDGKWAKPKYTTDNDYRVRQTVISDTTDENKSLILSYQTNTQANEDTARVVYKSSKFYANPSTGDLFATNFNGTLTGNVTGNVSGTAGSWENSVTVYTQLSTSGTDSTIKGGETSAVALKVNGTLGTGNGGLGNNSFTANCLLYSESTTKFSSTSDIYASTGAITINGTSAPANSGNFQVNGTSTMQKILPQTDATYDLGETATRWNSLYLDTSLLVGAKNTVIAYNSNAKGSFIGPAVFSVCVTSAEGGYYIMGAQQQYAKMYIDTIGTGTTTGLTYLELGNNKNSTTERNSRGIVRLYSDNTTYTDIQSQLTKSDNTATNKIFYLPQYTGTDQMYAVHVGSNNSVGSATQPVYVAAGGRITASTDTVGNQYIPTYLNAGTISQVYPIQYNEFTITGSSTNIISSSTLLHTAYNTTNANDMDIFILTIVVTNGMEYLQSPIEATAENNQIQLSAQVEKNKIVSGYILTARGQDLTNTT